MGDAARLEFAVGSEVHPGQFFKSNFARSFLAKSLDYNFMDNATIAEEDADNRNNNFYSLDSRQTVANGWRTNEVSPESAELERLRKQCQQLTEENRRLQTALTSSQVPHVQVIDNVFLQTQVDTLQWQLKQTEANRQMHRSLLEQVLRFLDRARKSLDILHEKSVSKEKSRVPRSRSVHTVHGDPSPSRATSASVSSSSSSSGSSRFSRAKSVTQISGGTFRDFTWSVLRRNDPVHCTPPRAKPQDLNQTHDGVVYRRPKKTEIDPDDVPPEKLSQEAFRLMRTVQSLLSMREPDLARVTPTEDTLSSPSPIEPAALHPEVSHNGSFHVQDVYHGSSSGSDSDRLQGLFPGLRRSLDASSSGSSKAEEEETIGNVSALDHDLRFPSLSLSTTSTPKKSSKPVNRLEKPASSRVEHQLLDRSGKPEKLDRPGKLDRTEKLERPTEKSDKSKPTEKPERADGGGSTEKRELLGHSKPKSMMSVSSAEDESGFSSLNSFQEVGIPASPAKGCHTEVGLPVVPLERIRNRRWSSTHAEFQSLLRQHRNFGSSGANESLSVWV